MVHQAGQAPAEARLGGGGREDLVGGESGGGRFRLNGTRGLGGAEEVVVAALFRGGQAGVDRGGDLFGERGGIEGWRRQAEPGFGVSGAEGEGQGGEGARARGARGDAEQVGGAERGHGETGDHDCETGEKRGGGEAGFLSGLGHPS